MTARLIDPDSRRRPLYAAVVLMLVIVAMLLAAGFSGKQGNFSSEDPIS